MTTSVTSTLASVRQAGASSQPSSPRNTLGKDDFLRLLTTQLQHQDPLSPMDSQDFIAQLAQFSSIEQLDGLGRKLDLMLVGQASANQLSTSSLVGKEVLYRADRVNLAAGAPARFEVTLPADAVETTAVIADASGRVVRTLTLGARAAGTSAVSWDGLDAAGGALPPGDYVVTVSATGADGGEVAAAAALRGVVAGITFENDSPELLVSGRHVRMADILQIGTAAGA